MGFWSKFGKIGSIIAPFALAPFTGGMSLPMSLALKGGVGAGLGALSGGKKGALAGGAAGAASAALPKLKIPGFNGGGNVAGDIGGVDAAVGKIGSGGGGVDLSMLSKLFGQGGGKLDPMMLAMMGMSAFGGDDAAQQRQSFRAPGQIQDPVQNLQQTLSAIYRMGQGLSEAPPTQLRSAVVQKPMSPVSLPGIPFQIGGGLGVDPAIQDPTLLQGRGVQDAQKYDPFQGVATNQFADAAKLRKPTNG